MTTVVVAVLAGMAAALLAPPGLPGGGAVERRPLAGPTGRSRPWSPTDGSWTDGEPTPGTPAPGQLRGAGGADPVHPLRRHRLLLAAGAGSVPLFLLGGVLGVLVAVPTTGWAWWLVGHLEPPSVRRRREEVARDLPHAIDLLAVVLASGASTSHALRAVAAALEPPLASELTAVERGLALGRDPVRVWRDAAARTGMRSLARAMLRALDTGASVADALHRLAAELQAERRLDDEARARSVGVRVAAPLGLCLLPAFVLVGVVPLVGSTAQRLLTP